MEPPYNRFKRSMASKETSEGFNERSFRLEEVYDRREMIASEKGLRLNEVSNERV